MQSLLKEPLLHFLAAGALMFLLYGLIAEEPSSNSTKRIVVTSEDIQRLGDSWKEQQKRSPSNTELHALIEAFIREEIYYREALAIGLDQQDPVIRRHLMQKMEFLSRDLADLSAPDESTLLAFMQANRQRYTPDMQISFNHIYFSPKRTGMPAEVAARRTRALLSENHQIAHANAGDNFVLADAFARESKAELVRLFGESFVNDLSSVPMGSWQGPIRSNYGIHLVRVDELVIPGMPELSTVYEQVKADWAFERRTQTNELFYDQLKAHYDIEIAPVPEASSGHPVKLPGQEAL